MELSTLELQYIVSCLYMAEHSELKDADKRECKSIRLKINQAVMANGGWEKLKERIG